MQAMSDRPPRPDFSWIRLNGELPFDELQRIDDGVSRPTDEQGGAAGDAVAQPGMDLELTPPPLRAVWGVVTGAYTFENEPSPADPLPLFTFRQIYHQGNQWFFVEGGVEGVALNVLGVLNVPLGVPFLFWPSEDAVRTQPGDEPAGAAGEKWRFSAFDPNHVTVPPDTTGSGSGGDGCDFTADGTACFETIIVSDTINVTYVNYLDWFNVSVVTGWCPVTTNKLTIDGVLRTVDPPVVIGGVVERRTIQVAVGTVLGDPFCETDPQSCCESGSGAGSGGPGPDNSCCSPMPPPTIWAVPFDFRESTCGCLPRCVRLDYDASRDGWYSALGTFADCDGTAASGCFRVRCRAGVWFWDVVDGADNLRLRGSVIKVVCDPFFMAAGYDDRTAGTVCTDLFSYVISEVDCTGGGGGTIDVPCCPDDLVPETLTATFGGSLAGLGAVTLTYDGGLSYSWSGSVTGTACGDATVTFFCGSVGGTWSISVLGSNTGGQSSLSADSCDPFRLAGTFLSTGPCAGTATFEVTG